MCIAKPWWGDGTIPDTEEIQGLEYHGKPSSEHPDWPWTLMDGAWSVADEWRRRTDYCNPDAFDMYIYNDFYGYGLMELQENLVSVFSISLEHV